MRVSSGSRLRQYLVHHHQSTSRLAPHQLRHVCRLLQVRLCTDTESPFCDPSSTRPGAVHSTFTPPDHHSTSITDQLPVQYNTDPAPPRTPFPFSDRSTSSQGHRCDRPCAAPSPQRNLDFITNVFQLLVHDNHSSSRLCLHC